MNKCKLVPPTINHTSLDLLYFHTPNWSTFTFMHLADAFTFYIYAFSRCFYPKRLTVHSGYTFIVSMCVPWESNPQPFALLMQCSTTEPQEHCIRKHFTIASANIGLIQPYMLEPETESEEEEEERIIQVIYKSVYQNGNGQEHKTSAMQCGEKNARSRVIWKSSKVEWKTIIVCGPALKVYGKHI